MSKVIEQIAVASELRHGDGRNIVAECIYEQIVMLLERKVEQLAAENAALKAGSGFFTYSEETGFGSHKTKAEAIASAEDMIAVCREEAVSDGWPEGADSICWGVIVQKAVEGQFEKPSEANGWIGWSEYSLVPSIETPATDAILAEVRAGGVDSAIAELNQLAERSEKEAPVAAEHHRSASLYLQLFATQLRQGAAK